MKRKIICIFSILIVLINTCSCALLQKPIDNRTGFSIFLMETENSIRYEDWEKAKVSLEQSKKTWEKIKPLFQVDIDHDYVNSIENDFIKLEGYIETKEKASSLATILLVQDTWKSLGIL